MDNIYWKGEYIRTEQNVDSTTDCCKLCKEDVDCTNFSYGKGKVGHATYGKCYLNKGGNEDRTVIRGHNFISSPKDISGCTCATGMYHTPL